jgi:glycosyltransferase involved in cell wall biosynthesis
MDQPTIAVDLTPLLPGGANGGIKPYIMEGIPWLRKRLAGRCRFLFLTSTVSHDEVRGVLAAECDRLVCVNVNSEVRGPEFQGRGDRDFLWRNAPPDLLWRLSAGLLYCPFGATTWHCPGIPTLSVVVDLLHLDFPDSLDPGERDHRRAYFRKMASDTDLFQCISDYGAARLVEACGVEVERVFRTYLVLGGRLQSGRPTRAPAGRPYFFYPANFWPHKNHGRLLEAYADYLAKAPDDPWDLVLTGFDSLECQQALRRAAQLGLDRHVRYEGHVGDERLEELWASASALVFPSLHEGFGIPLVEAMCFGLPIICGRTTCLGEVAGDAALFADPSRPEELSAAMLRLATDAVLRRDLGANSAARRAVFDFDREMHALSESVERLLRTGAARPTMTGLEDGMASRGQILLHPGRQGWHVLSGLFESPHGPAGMRLRCGNRIFGTWPVGTAIEAEFFCDGAPVILEFSEAEARVPRPVPVSCRSLAVHADDGAGGFACRFFPSGHALST